jgi:alpha-1,3-rhamnosyl/mannosyltransferase
MRVVINGLAALKPKTGVGHHVSHLGQALMNEFPDDTFWLYPGERLSRFVRQFNRGSSSGSDSTGVPSLVHRLLARVRDHAKRWGKRGSRFHFSRAVRRARFDLYHEPNFVPFQSPLPTVVTVHDLSVLRYPDWHPADRVRLHHDHFADGVQRAAHVIAVSNSIRIEVIDRLGLPPDRVTTVYNGIDPAFRPLAADRIRSALARLGIPPRYFVAVGTIEPRKNIGAVMRAFAELPAAVRADCPLVLVGPWGWKSESERKYFETTGRERGVLHPGYVADEDLPAVYSGAVCLLYPSFYEGFGLPPVEMLAGGGRVVAARIPAVQEVCGPHCIYVEPDDLAGWKAAMLQAATDPDIRQKDRDAGIQHARQYSWCRAARETMAVYQKALGRTTSATPHCITGSLPRPAA